MTSTQLRVINNDALMSIWECPKSLNQIKQLFAPRLTDLEFRAYVELGKATGLDPFLRELWAVKYDERAPAQIFIGRDGYRKSAQAHPLYDYHRVDAIYSNDQFIVRNGVIDHEYSFMDRGSLVGAYCIVKRKNATEPTHAIINMKEYSTGKSLWNAKPETMIKKVAEAQALRMAFQERFAGTYHEDEDYIKDPKPDPIKVKALINDLIASKAQEQQEQQEVVVAVETGELVSESTLKTIADLIDEKNISYETVQKLNEHFGVNYLTELTALQGEKCVAWLRKQTLLADKQEIDE